MKKTRIVYVCDICEIERLEKLPECPICERHYCKECDHGVNIYIGNLKTYFKP